MTLGPLRVTSRRFAELQRRMPGVSQKMLSATLQTLVRDGLAARRVEPTVPPRVYYQLTAPRSVPGNPACRPAKLGPSSTWPRSRTTS
jgi:DNA-binding HxlR family transcriptional regulator